VDLIISGQITQFAAQRVLRDDTASETDWYVHVKSDADYSKEVQQITEISKKFHL